MKLLWKLVKKDLLKNKIINLVLILFLLLSATLLASGFRITGTMISSLKGLNEIAVPPDFLQMHKGTYDESQIEEFTKSHPYIEAQETVAMLDISNSNIYYQDQTMEDCLMDNGFIVQNEQFDFLLNEENQIASVNPGEIGVPVYYADELGMQVGEHIVLKTNDYQKEFIISTIIKDAQMNAALTSSKRFLINEKDMEEISSYLGEWEYCFEYLINEEQMASMKMDITKDYLEAGMPANGVAITGSLLTMLNAISYGLIAFMILAVSLLLTMIAMLCLSYIIKATLAEEGQGIGTMKAIGFPGNSIRQLYQLKYVLFMVIAATMGYILSIMLGGQFAKPVIRYCGVGNSSWLGWLFSGVAILLWGLFILLKCRRLIQKNLKQTVVELMRGTERKRKEGHYHLPVSSCWNKNLTIAAGELKCKWKEYIVLLFVFLFAAIIVLLPLNMKNTIENPSFITYMGIGKCDIRIDIPNGVGIEEQKGVLENYLISSHDISQYAFFQNGYLQLQDSEGEFKYVRTSSGDETVFPLQYEEGNAPASENEIAISSLNARELSKKVGDTLITRKGEEKKEYIVSGIYQDITYGGKTAKATVNYNASETEGYVIYIDVTNANNMEEIETVLRELVPGARVTPITEFISQTLGGIVGNMGMLVKAAVIICMILIVLITSMFLQLLMAREHREIAIKKALGFSVTDIRIQMALRILILQTTAIILGTIFAKFVGESLFGIMLSSMGTSKIHLLINPLTTYFICPSLEILLCGFTIWIGTGIIRSYHIRDQIME